jgi:hypothetical protein
LGLPRRPADVALELAEESVVQLEPAAAQLTRKTRLVNVVAGPAESVHRRTAGGERIKANRSTSDWRRDSWMAAHKKRTGNINLGRKRE